MGVILVLLKMNLLNLSIRRPDPSKKDILKTLVIFSRKKRS